MVKKIIKKLDSKIINSITPFSEIAYKKRKEINVFVGREQSIETLIGVLNNNILGDRSFGVSISGPGGCGKSTLFGYFYQMITSQEIFQYKHLQLEKNQCEIITAFIDAPKGEPTTLRYFWTSIIDALAEENSDFLEDFAALLFRKCLHVLWKSNFYQEKIGNVLGKFIPDFQENVKLNNIIELINSKKFLRVLTTNLDILTEIRNIITSGWRILQNYEVTFGILGKTGDFNQKRFFKAEKQYFDLLFDILSPDYDKSSEAQDIFKGVKEGLIESDSDVIKVFKWLINTWEWVIEKPISFAIGIDNIGYMTVNIEDFESAYIPFIQTILQMRDSLKKFLFVLIGTNEDWRLFNEYIDNHQDYRTQLRGFLIKKIELTRLTLEEVLEALSLMMTRFWNQAGLIHPSNPIYPFTKEFFSYLYEYHAHEYREILLFLDNVWTYFKQSTQIFEFNNSFEMIKFVRLTLSSNIIKELFYSTLLDWEK
ncbi:MAG: hypothetical protein P8Y97_16400, partial [Candidatus Lokiarchaeota archaeon]